MTQSGVNPTLYTPYAFADHRWCTGAQPQPDLLELAERCVRVDNDYWLKLPNTGTWQRFADKIGVTQARNTWAGGKLRSGATIDDALIDTFFSGIEKQTIKVGTKQQQIAVPVGACPIVAGRMMIPYGPQCLTYNGSHYLNIANVKILAGDSAHLNVGKLMLIQLYRALCNGPRLHDDRYKEADILIDCIKRNDYRHGTLHLQDFEFVMNWLAANSQFPGVNLQTNLWLLGRLEGVGKGTLVTVMSQILSRELVGRFNQAEVEAGWTDHLFGRTLIEVNEFAETRKMSLKAWEQWVKQHTCETDFQVRARNIGSWTTINTANYLFTTNVDRNPIYLDTTNRRDQFVHTTDDPYWKEAASYLQRDCVIPHPERIGAGFAYILEQVRVNFGLLKSAYRNQVKADIQAESAGYDRRTEEWVATSPTLVHDKWISAGDLWSAFRMWHEDSYPGRDASMPNRNRWSRDLKTLACVEAVRPGDRFPFPDAGRLATDYHFRIGRVVDVAAVSSAEVAADLAPFLGVAPIPVVDQAMPVDPPISEARRRFLRMRELLQHEASKRASSATNADITDELDVDEPVNVRVGAH